MKLALVDGIRREASRGLVGNCQVCSEIMIPKCGEKRISHWSHRTKVHCDHWWENETEWHRLWKAQFPTEWQEIVSRDLNGEKHIADVRTAQNWVIEFQYSYLSAEERRSRDSFYSQLVWIVSGKRRKKDISQFSTVWEWGVPVRGNQSIKKLVTSNCHLLREWAHTNAPVFFDFGPEYNLFWLFPQSPEGFAYVAVFPRASFIELHLGGPKHAQEFASVLQDFSKFILSFS